MRSRATAYIAIIHAEESTDWASSSAEYLPYSWMGEHNLDKVFYTDVLILNIVGQPSDRRDWECYSDAGPKTMMR
jgi:hypothetical protein